MKKLAFLFAALAACVSLSVRAEFSAWVYDYGSNTPREAQETWTESNLVDTSAGAANATFSGAYNSEKNCFDGKTNTRWIQQTKTPWVIYKFPAATKITAYGVRQATNNGYDSRVPNSWELYGSNAETPPTTVDDASWEKLDERASVFHNFSKDNNYDFGSRVMWLAQIAQYRSYLLKVTANKSDGYTVIGELEFYNAPFPCDVKFVEVPTVSYQNGAFKVSGSFNSPVDCEISAVISDGTTETVESVGSFNGDAEDQLIEYTIPSTLDANKTYSVYFSSAIGDATAESKSVEFYNGTLTLSKLNDASEENKAPAVLTVSRVSADPFALAVNVLFTEGTAKEGQNYEPAQSPVVIPANEATATFNVVPLIDGDTDEDTAMTVSIPGGVSKDDTPAVTVTIVNRGIPMDKNVWIPTDGNLASTAANWSLGRVPTASDDVLIDGGFGKADMIWDGGENGLGDTVKSWTQTEGYTGTVTIKTKYPDVDGSTAMALNITGNLALDTGTWTHPANSTSEDSRLKVIVGGNVSIASGVKIDVSGKGFAKGKTRPGSAQGCHASPMDFAGFDKLYGDVKKPEALGSGNDKGAGGGAIYIEASGSFVNDGELNANSLGGAAGSIYVKAASVSGAGTYTARAPESVGGSYKAGSGGRIAFELTDSESITSDEDAFVNGKCTTGFAFNGRNSAACGTIFVKTTTHANGILYVDGQSGASYSYVRLQPEFKNMLAIPAGETWVLDGIVFLNKSIAALKVPTGTTLSLPGGLASVKAYGAGGEKGIGGRGGNIATGHRGLVIDGGALVLPTVEEHLIANNWTLQANQSFTLAGDVRVNAGGRIGVVAGYGTSYSYTNRCDLTVTGDLTIESKGSIDATGAGWKNYTDALPAGWGWTVNGECGAHGGVSKNHSSAVNYVYDSILNPMLPGEGAQKGDAGNAQFGGGCVKLTVSGKLTLAGNANAKANYQDGNGGAGGTINITCGSIEGAGTINVTTQTGYGGTQGGGGRVAIRLTDKDADFTAYPLSQIVVAQSGAQSSGGTVYLQTAAEGEGCGTVYVKGDAGNTATCLTPFPSLAGGGETDDFSQAKLQVVNNGKVVLAANVKVGEFGMGNVGVMDLNGMALTAARAFLTDASGSALPKLESGVYTAVQLNEITGTSVFSDSVGGGSLVVGGTGMALIIR